jgi:hypothetical protein
MEKCLFAQKRQKYFADKIRCGCHRESFHKFTFKITEFWFRIFSKLPDFGGNVMILLIVSKIGQLSKYWKLFLKLIILKSCSIFWWKVGNGRNYVVIRNLRLKLGTDVLILKIFSPKNQRKNWRVFDSKQT